MRVFEPRIWHLKLPFWLERLLDPSLGMKRVLLAAGPSVSTDSMLLDNAREASQILSRRIAELSPLSPLCAMMPPSRHFGSAIARVAITQAVSPEARLARRRHSRRSLRSDQRRLLEQQANESRCGYARQSAEGSRSCTAPNRRLCEGRVTLATPL